MFVIVDSINTSNLLLVKRHLSGLNIRPAMLKTHLLLVSEFDFFQTTGHDVFSCVMAFGLSASAA